MDESGDPILKKIGEGSSRYFVMACVIFDNDNEAEKQVTISGLRSNQARITEAVPKLESGKDVTDYNGAFNTKNEKIENGKITLIIKDIPVFIEETASSDLPPLEISAKIGVVSDKLQKH